MAFTLLNERTDKKQPFLSSYIFVIYIIICKKGEMWSEIYKESIETFSR